MDFIEKCKVAGLGNGSAYEGYPVVDNRIFSKRDGTLKAYTLREDPKPWEDPFIEDPNFDAATLKKIEDIEVGSDANLSVDEKQAIADALAAEEAIANTPSILELDARLKAVEAALA